MALIVQIPPPRIDWRTERDRIDLAAVVTRLLGPAPGRRGGRGLWWCCPLHDDRNPSFRVYRDAKGDQWWQCFGCGEHGDGPALVMRLEGMTFPEAVRWIVGDAAPASTRKPPTRPPERSAALDSRSASPTTTRPPRVEPDAPGRMLTREQAAALVEAAAARLWTPEGAEALAYLTGRGLRPETIRAARLGVTGPVADLSGRPRGIVVPWFVGDRPALVKIRQPEGVKPKYREAYRDRDRPPELYPGPEAIRPGCPLVVVEGELDALLLGQALGELAAVVTLGSAGAGPDVGIFGEMLSAPSWFVAHDADPAGDGAAAVWTATTRARRVRPPEPFNDWTDAGTDAPGTNGTALDLRRWWAAVLAGDEAPPPYSWHDLARWRWGPGAGLTELTPKREPSAPGIDARGRARPDELAERLAAGALDPEAIAERAAIQAEHEAV